MIGDGKKKEVLRSRERNRPLAQPRLKYKPLGDDLLRGAIFLFANGQSTQVILGILARSSWPRDTGVDLYLEL
jgi:hypothetical protein